MAKKQVKTDGVFKVIHCEKTGDKKAVSEESLKAFKNNSPDAGDYVELEETFDTLEAAQNSILETE